MRQQFQEYADFGRAVSLAPSQIWIIRVESCLCLVIGIVFVFIPGYREGGKICLFIGIVLLLVHLISIIREARAKKQAPAFKSKQQ